MSQKPTGNIKKENGVSKLQEDEMQDSFYLCDVLACKRPTASLARFMCKPPAFRSPIDLAEKNEAVAEKTLHFRHRLSIEMCVFSTAIF